MNFDSITKSLTENGFSVKAFSTIQEAKNYLNSSIDGESVGFGGSMTLEKLGIIPLLSTHNEVYSHWHTKEGLSAEETRKRAMTTKVYLSSVNAIAETGEIVNIDGTGNRIASTVFGHERVYFVVGKNKITPNLESAIFRARNVASPQNSKRLCRKTPCALAGEQCFNCKSPERICRAMTVMWQPTTGEKCEVVFIDEELGF